MITVITTFSVVVIGVLGALLGSFANVVIYRLPRRESIVFPGSACPHCNHRIGPLDLIPVLSWLALRGRCRSCRQPIGVRYPLVETLMAAGFVALALRWPPALHGASVLPLLALFAMLVMAAVIDLDTLLLPDSLTLPAVAVALLGTLLYAEGSGLPTPGEALVGGAVGAGVIALINRIGSLVLRRFADTAERLWPLGLDQVNIAALAGAIGGWQVGLGAAALSLLANLVTRRTLRLPEGLVYGLWAAALVVAAGGLSVPLVTAIAGSLIAAGVVAVLGAGAWWIAEIRGVTPAEPDGNEVDEPVAMGFGDVKLAAVLGAMLGWERLLVGLFLAVTLGAVAGVIGRLAGGSRLIPFGPALVLGGVLALFFGDAILSWYLSMLGAA